MSMNEAQIRRQQVIDRLIQLKAEKLAKDRIESTTIVGGQIVHQLKPEPPKPLFPGTGHRLGTDKESIGKSGPGLPNVTQARQVKKAIDDALDKAVEEVTKVDSQSPFLEDLDAIRSEIGRYMSSDIDKLQVPNYQGNQCRRAAALAQCAEPYVEIQKKVAKAGKDMASISYPGGTEVAEVSALIDASLKALREKPNEAASIKAEFLNRIEATEGRAKKATFQYWFNWGDKPGLDKRVEIGTMLSFLQKNMNAAATMSYIDIKDKFQALVWPATWPKEPKSTVKKLGRSKLPTMSRSAAVTAGAVMGKVALKGASEAGREPAAVELYFTGGVTNLRAGPDPLFRHWHVFGDARNNMVVQAGGAILGFVDFHIDTSHPATAVEGRGDLIDIGVYSGTVVEIV